MSRVTQGQRVEFEETMAVIQQYFVYQPIRFSNGAGADQIINEAGTNEGSCKIFAFAQLHQLSKEFTLTLFGEYYWSDVMQNPNGTNHQNIRNFIKYGWDHIRMDGQALIPKT